MTDENNRDYVSTLETAIRHKDRQLERYKKIIKMLSSEARPGHLTFMRQMYGTKIMTEHAEGKEGCAICNLLKEAKRIYDAK